MIRIDTLIFLAMGTVVLAQAPPPAPPPGGPLQHLLGGYLEGRWDEVEGLFAGPGREIQAIPVSEKPKVDYMRQSLAEGRPPWWKKSKAGEKFAFTPSVWGHAVTFTFDPKATFPVQSSLLHGQLYLTVNWPTTDMDNAAPAERGFSKGDVSCVNVWSALGTAEAWSGIPLEAQTNLKQDATTLMQQYLDFRSNLTAVYYATPKARRLALWLCLVMYVGENAGNPVRTAREAVAAMFMDEVAAHPAKYPSIQLPKTLPAGDVEEKLAVELRNWVEKHGWTLAEDKFLRDAVADCAKANGRPAHLKGQITLANGLAVALDPEKDKLLHPKRDLWLKSKLDAAVPAP